MALQDVVFVRGVIDEVEPVGRRMRRIRIVGERLRGLGCMPGQHVRVNVLPPGGAWLRHLSDARRTYSVWALDAEAGELELCVLDHGDGPGAVWAREARPGQEVSFSRPEGRLVLGDTTRHLFVGDETAAVAFGAMLRALPDSAVVDGVLEAEASGDEVPLPGVHTLPWVYRGALLDAVRALDLSGPPGTAYLAGEARTCQAVRQHLIRERAWPRQAIVVKPFWTPGRKGME